MNIFTSNALFGIVLSLIAFEIGLLLYKRTKFPLFNPLLIAIALVIGFLLLFKIDFKTYNQGGQFINMFLGPATVILAVPLYKQIKLLKAYGLPIFIGIFVGSAVGIISIILLSYAFKLDPVIIKSLAPKAVTTPIGMEISSELHGIVPITVVAIVITGIIGAMIGPLICKIFGIKNKVAIGISLGTASHAVGTSKALEIGETEGAMSSLSIGLAGLMTVFLAPFIYNILSGILHFYK
ncbi:LrgB family protein [Clostridium folliculivorans]|uniref:LrgB family protein n=1 Tax=Clostridium folliculivorans TaxID=2886038 RepID=A0A9W6DAQ8_9CLOT|nr:LrgB family protein [Clostridium folliculivorans]GKU25484.1 LrgB family protein [Clostridium folliculivorans]GKU28506.1 LrgB family protein [Clostridium folliculivorans]